MRFHDLPRRSTWLTTRWLCLIATPQSPAQGTGCFSTDPHRDPLGLACFWYEAYCDLSCINHTSHALSDTASMSSACSFEQKVPLLRKSSGTLGSSQFHSCYNQAVASWCFWHGVFCLTPTNTLAGEGAGPGEVHQCLFVTLFP